MASSPHPAACKIATPILVNLTYWLEFRDSKFCVTITSLGTVCDVCIYSTCKNMSWFTLIQNQSFSLKKVCEFTSGN